MDAKARLVCAAALLTMVAAGPAWAQTTTTAPESGPAIADDDDEGNGDWGLLGLLGLAGLIPLVMARRPPRRASPTSRPVPT